jgi:hypothetical protein
MITQANKPETKNEDCITNIEMYKLDEIRSYLTYKEFAIFVLLTSKGLRARTNIIRVDKPLIDTPATLNLLGTFAFIPKAVINSRRLNRDQNPTKLVTTALNQLGITRKDRERKLKTNTI